MYVLKPFDPWKSRLCTCPFKYSLNPYTGCAHACLYCYASSYIRKFFAPRPKKDFIKLLRKDLEKVKPGLVMISPSTDPYQPLEKEFELTRKAIELLSSKGWRILITTKSDLWLRDLDILEKSKVAVAETITTMEKKLAKKLEPGAPEPKKRIDALASADLPKALRLDPIIPGLNSGEESIEEVLLEAKEAGVKHVVFSVYKAKPDSFSRLCLAFPELCDYWKSIYRGMRVSGYVYVIDEVRLRILKRASELAEKLGFTWAFCREGLAFKAPSCDGSHLIKP